MARLGGMSDGRTAICLVRRGAEVYELPVEEFDAIDGLRQEPQTIVWLQLDSPTDQDLRLLQDEFAIHPLAMEDLRKRGQRAKLDTYPDQHMLVVYEAIQRGPSTATNAGADQPPPFELSELHAFCGPGWLVTVQWGASPAVGAAAARFRRAAPQGATVGGMLHAFFDAAVDSYFPVLDANAERMDALEDRVLAGDGGSESLAEMLAIKRQLLELRRVLAPMREAANALLRRETPLLDDGVAPYFQDLYDHLVRLLDQLDLYRDLLASVLDARLTVANNSLNAVMKRLTAITVVLMAPTLIAGIYGMNFDFMPELHWELGYPFALGLMLTVMIGALTYFRLRDWF